jgi:hypothetical protein
VERHNDHFPQGTEDIAWLREVGRRDWVAVTKDKKIRTRSFERTALINANVRAFVLGSGRIEAARMAEIFSAAMPEMLKLIARQPPPFVARVDQNAKILLMYP